MDVAVHGRVVLVDGDAVKRLLAGACAEGGAAVGILRIDLHPLPGRRIVTTGQAERSTELQVIDAGTVGQPGLLGEYPTDRGRWERAPMVLGSKLGGSIRTQQELEQILVGVSIVGSTDVGKGT